MKHALCKWFWRCISYINNFKFTLTLENEPLLYIIAKFHTSSRSLLCHVTFQLSRVQFVLDLLRNFLNAEEQTRIRLDSFLRMWELAKMKMSKNWKREMYSIDPQKTNIAHLPCSLTHRFVHSLWRILQKNLVAFVAVICRFQCVLMRSALRSP